MTKHARSAKTIRDPVHGDILVFAEDLPLLDAPPVQRLRGIKQLGSAHHVYPGATHTRFEHCLGTYHVASRLVDRIRRSHRRDPASCRDVSASEAAVIRAVALLHDLTHIPHGHAIEDQDGLFPRHDTPRFLRSAVEDGALGTALRRRRILAPVAAHLTESGAKASSRPFLSLVANGPLGADMLDYLRRDGHYTGLRLDYDDRLLDFIKVDPASGVVYVDLVKHDMDREDILTEIVSLLRSRYLSSERIYYHHAKLASGVLVSRAVELAIQGGLTRRDVAGSTDDLLPGILLDRDYAGHPLGADRARKTIAGLLDRYRERRLLKRCFVLARPRKAEFQNALVRTVVGDQKKRMALEAAVARALDLPDPAEVIVYCPRKGMQLKEATVPVRRAGKGIRPLSAYRKEFPALDQLVEAYRDLWKLYVFVPITDPDRLNWAGAVVEKILRRSFPGIRNQYHP
jgi:hypothetical protein